MRQVWAAAKGGIKAGWGTVREKEVGFGGRGRVAGCPIDRFGSFFDARMHTNNWAMMFHFGGYIYEITTEQAHRSVTVASGALCDGVRAHGPEPKRSFATAWGRWI